MPYALPNIGPPLPNKSDIGQQPTKLLHNTVQDKGVTKLMLPLPTMSPFRTDVAHVAD